MTDTITLKELLAVIVRRGKKLIALCLVFAVIFGAYCIFQRVRVIGSPENSSEVIEEAYQEELEVYQECKSVLDEQYQKRENNLKAYQQHLLDSVLMQLDPSCKASTVIDLAITELNAKDFETVFQV